MVTGNKGRTSGSKSFGRALAKKNRSRGPISSSNLIQGLALARAGAGFSAAGVIFNPISGNDADLNIRLQLRHGRLDPAIQALMNVAFGGVDQVRA
jgi:hypothetical protein